VDTPAQAPRADRRGLALGAFAGVVFVLLHLAPRIPQDVRYHAFADARTFCGIPYFNDVVSNAPFLAVGAVGLLLLRRRGGAVVADGAERSAWRIAFAGVFATGFGSAYYHWNPTHETLAWDRLPMTICFAAFVAAQLAECVGPTVGGRLTRPLVLFGAGSVGYWAWSEGAGRGDLRWYAYVQFFPLVFTPLLWRLFPRKYDRLSDFGAAALWYAVAKVCEALDRPIFAATGGVIAGHALKHVAAALATACLVRHLARRRPRAAAAS
jgi:hypothetical protein